VGLVVSLSHSSLVIGLPASKWPMLLRTENTVSFAAYMTHGSFLTKILKMPSAVSSFWELSF
jgi:hypothetical protein